MAFVENSPNDSLFLKIFLLRLFFLSYIRSLVSMFNTKDKQIRITRLSDLLEPVLTGFSNNYEKGECSDFPKCCSKI